MAKYVHGNVGHFLFNKDNVIKENTVPKNIDPMIVFDHSLAKIVEGKKKSFTDKDLETVHENQLFQIQCGGYKQL